MMIQQTVSQMPVLSACAWNCDMDCQNIERRLRSFHTGRGGSRRYLARHAGIS
ncbi:MAG: hypothetical protein LUI07_02755 [Lachnospiraceae bacterium]|nr:hypothetical protein [Lachnospiraceae bacterium]